MTVTGKEIKGVKSSVEGLESADCSIDASGLHCPEPLVLCKQAMASIGPGGLVHVIATDPHAEIDFEVFARRTNHELVHSVWEGDTYHALIRVA